MGGFVWTPLYGGVALGVGPRWGVHEDGKTRDSEVPNKVFGGVMGHNSGQGGRKVAFAAAEAEKVCE